MIQACPRRGWTLIKRKPSGPDEVRLADPPSGQTNCTHKPQTQLRDPLVGQQWRPGPLPPLSDSEGCGQALSSEGIYCSPQSCARDLRTGSDQPQGRESDCNLPAAVRDGPRKLLRRVEGLGAEEPKKVGGKRQLKRQSSQKRELRPRWLSTDLSLPCSLAPKHSTQLFHIGRSQVFIAKLIRGYLRDKKQSASLASVHKEPPQKLQSKQVSSQEPALNNRSHDLFQVSLQLSLCSGGNRMTAARPNQ